MPSDLLEKAKAWLESNTRIRWVTEPEHGIEVSELNRRPARYASWLADFAADRENDICQKRLV